MATLFLVLTTMSPKLDICVISLMATPYSFGNRRSSDFPVLLWYMRHPYPLLPNQMVESS